MEGRHAKRFLAVFKAAGRDFVDDRAPHHAAALSYYALIALGPLLLIATALAGLLFGVDAARQAVTQQVSRFVGQEAADGLGALMAEGDAGTSATAFSLGLVALLFGAAGVFRHLQDSLDAIWEVREEPPPGLWPKLVHGARRYLLGVGGVLSVGFLLMVSLLVSAFITAAASFAQGLLPGGEALWRTLHLVAATLVTSLLFALMFRYLPNADVAWRDVLVGAVMAGTLFVLGQVLIGLYLGQATPGSQYGAAGTLVTVLVWLYYSGLTFFYGAEVTQAYANSYGSRIRPDEDAVHRPRSKTHPMRR